MIAMCGFINYLRPKNENRRDRAEIDALLDYTDESLVWESEHPEIAQVKDGILCAYTESPELNGEYAEFLTGNSEHSELAAFRAEYGILEPVKVFAYELGNELDGEFSAEEYCERAEKAIRAIRAKDPKQSLLCAEKLIHWSWM